MRKWLICVCSIYLLLFAATPDLFGMKKIKELVCSCFCPDKTHARTATVYPFEATASTTTSSTSSASSASPSFMDSTATGAKIITISAYSSFKGEVEHKYDPKIANQLFRNIIDENHVLSLEVKSHVLKSRELFSLLKNFLSVQIAPLFEKSYDFSVKHVDITFNKYSQNHSSPPEMIKFMMGDRFALGTIVNLLPQNLFEQSDWLYNQALKDADYLAIQTNVPCYNHQDIPFLIFSLDS